VADRPPEQHRRAHVHREELRGNFNVRDYNHNHRTTNDLITSYVRRVYDNHHGQRVDMQTWTLPDAFADETLAKIRFGDAGHDKLRPAPVWASTVVTLDPDAARLEALALLDEARAQRASANTPDARALIEQARNERTARDERTNADHH